MSDIEKASQDAVQAAQQGEQFALMLAAIEAAKQPAPACQHQHDPVQRESGGAGKWLGIGIGGSIFMVAFSLSAVAFAIAAMSVAVVALVLWGIWKDVRGRR